MLFIREVLYQLLKQVITIFDHTVQCNCDIMILL